MDGAIRGILGLNFWPGRRTAPPERRYMHTDRVEHTAGGSCPRGPHRASIRGPSLVVGVNRPSTDCGGARATGCPARCSWRPQRGAWRRPFLPRRGRNPHPVRSWSELDSRAIRRVPWPFASSRSASRRAIRRYGSAAIAVAVSMIRPISSQSDSVSDSGVRRSSNWRMIAMDLGSTGASCRYCQCV